jgi:hypothetical protein
MTIFLVIERWSYDLKQLAPLESKIISAHKNHEDAMKVACNTHPWDMNYTDWRVEVQELQVH